MPRNHRERVVAAATDDADLRLGRGFAERRQIESHAIVAGAPDHLHAAAICDGLRREHHVGVVAINGLDALQMLGLVTNRDDFIEEPNQNVVILLGWLQRREINQNGIRAHQQARLELIENQLGWRSRRTNQPGNRRLQPRNPLPSGSERIANHRRMLVSFANAHAPHPKLGSRHTR